MTTPSNRLRAQHGRISLEQGGHRDIEASEAFAISSDKAISVGQFVTGQVAAGVPSDQPGGDPSFVLVPPVEQFRRSYAFLTPEGYAFDFIVVVAPPTAEVEVDGESLPEDCEAIAADGLGLIAYRCQLSFPGLVAPEGGGPWEVLDGEQADGPHVLEATEPVGLLLYGFDSFTSYAFPGGTSLRRMGQ
jgi:hypothetical protein